MADDTDMIGEPVRTPRSVSRNCRRKSRSRAKPCPNWPSDRKAVQNGHSFTEGAFCKEWRSDLPP